MKRTAFELAILAAIVAVVVAPTLFSGVMYPFDSTLFAANGALFEALYRDLGAALSSPAHWLREYYEQYPALFVRRHPPLYGAIEGLVFTIGGVSITQAKLTIAVFGALFGFAAYALGRAISGDRLLALTNAALLLTVPMVSAHYVTVWADIPAMAFGLAALAVYVASARPDFERPGRLALLGAAVLGSLYTYPMTIAWFAALALHHLVSYRLEVLAQRRLLAAAVVVALVCVPLAIQQIVLAGENLTSVLGGVPSGSDRFVPTGDRASLAYWTYYVVVLAQHYPVQTFGALLWTILLPWRTASRGERLILACAVLAYLLLSLNSAKNPRYALYIAVPLSFLGMVALGDVACRIARASGRLRAALVASAGLALVWTQVAALPDVNLYGDLSGVEQMAAEVANDAEGERIFYSGRFDAAFVFAVRSIDDARRFRVARASVQVERPEDLPGFWRQFDPDVVLVEQEDADRDVSVYNDFRDAIGEAFARPDAPYALWRTYKLSYYGGGTRRDITVLAYRRSGPPTN